MTKMRSPTKTELLVMRAHVDSMLNPQDAIGPHAHLSAIRSIIVDCQGDWWLDRYLELEKQIEKFDPRKSDNPELRDLIAAVDRWNSKAEWKRGSGNPVERNRHDELMAEMQGNESHPADCLCNWCKPLPVARGSSFEKCYAEFLERRDAQEDKA